MKGAFLTALCTAALLVAVGAGTADAGKGGKGGGGGGGGVPTNYGCSTLKAGFRVYNSTSSKFLLTSMYACYLCNMTTGVCALQSPSSLVGWYFNLPL